MHKYIEINQQDILPNGIEIIDLDEIEKAQTGRTIGIEQWKSRNPFNSFDNPNTYKIIQDDITNRLNMRNMHSSIYKDELSEIDKLKSELKNQRSENQALRRENRLDLRIPRLERRINSENLTQDRINTINPRREEFSLGKNQYLQGLDNLQNQELISKIKGYWDRRGKRMTERMSNKLKYQDLDTKYEPATQALKSKILSDKQQGREILTDIDISNKDKAIPLQFANRVMRAEDRLRRRADRLGIDYDPNSLNEEDFSGTKEVDRFQQFGGYNIDLLKNNDYNIDRYKVKSTPNIIFEEPDLVNWSLKPVNDTDFINRNVLFGKSNNRNRAADELNRTYSNQLYNYNLGRNTSAGIKDRLNLSNADNSGELVDGSSNSGELVDGSSNSGELVDGSSNSGELVDGSRSKFNLFNTDGEYELKYPGNRLQHYGNMLPAMWNISKYITDKPEKEPLVAPSQAYTEKSITPDVLPLLRNKMQNIDLIRRNARNTGDVMANIQQLHANTMKQEADLANKVQIANVAEKSKYEMAKQDYLDKYQQEILRKNATDRANRLSWENLGSDAMTEMQEALINKGQMLNQEYKDKVSLDTYLNNLVDDYKIVQDANGNMMIEFIKDGKKGRAPLNDVQYQANLMQSEDANYVSESNVRDGQYWGDKARGNATTPASGESNDVNVKKKFGGNLKRRNSLYY